MKNNLVLIFTLILLSIGLQAKAHDFSKVNNDGDTIYYNVTSSIMPYAVEVTYRNVLSQADSNRYVGEIDVKGFSQGIYNIRILNSNYNITKKLIVK